MGHFEEKMILEQLGQILRQHGCTVSLPEPQPATEAEEALSAIAAALRRETDDFFCVDEIIEILERQGFQTIPRHDFG